MVEVATRLLVVTVAVCRGGNLELLKLLIPINRPGGVCKMYMWRVLAKKCSCAVIKSGYYNCVKDFATTQK